MDNLEFDLPLPKMQRELLLNLVKKAKKHNVLSAPVFKHSTGDGEYYLHFIFIEDEKDDSLEVKLHENPIQGFEVLGFVVRDVETKDETIFFTPKLFKWSDYENKNWFLKFLARLPSKVKDFMIVVAFVLSLILTVLQILQSLKPAP